MFKYSFTNYTYQRPVDQRRIDKIIEYLQNDKFRFFSELQFGLELNDADAIIKLNELTIPGGVKFVDNIKLTKSKFTFQNTIGENPTTKLISLEFDDNATKLSRIDGNHRLSAIEKVFEVTVEAWAEQDIYTDYPLIWESRKTYTEQEAADMRVRSSDEEVCEAEKVIISDDSADGGYRVRVRLTGKAPGRAVIVLEDQAGDAFDGVQAVVTQLPEDGVIIADDNLRSSLLASEDMNKNMDGYISKEEITSCWKLELKDTEIKDFSELSMAQKLRNLTISGCGLKSLGDLPKMTQLSGNLLPKPKRKAGSRRLLLKKMRRWTFLKITRPMKTLRFTNIRAAQATTFTPRPVLFRTCS